MYCTNVVLVFGFTPIQDATEHYHHPQLVGDPLRMVLNFNEALGNVTEDIT